MFWMRAIVCVKCSFDLLWMLALISQVGRTGYRRPPYESAESIGEWNTVLNTMSEYAACGMNRPF